MRRALAIAAALAAPAAIALPLAGRPGLSQAGTGCQRMWFQESDGTLIPFSGCYGFKAPPPGDVWFMTTDAERGHSIDRADVIQLFPGKPPATARPSP